MSRFALVTSPILLTTLLASAQDQSGGAELVKQLDTRAAALKTLAFDFAISGLGPGDVKGQVRFKAPDRFLFRMTMPAGRGREEEPLEVKSDGRRVLARGPRGLALANTDPVALAQSVRTTLTRSTVAFSTVWSTAAPATVSDVRIEGTEKIGGIDAAVLAHTMTWERPKATFQVKSWIDRERLLPLKREVVMQGRTITEAYSDWKVDGDLPDDLFALQSLKSLAEGRALQIERAVALFSTYTGRPPRSLHDLTNCPEWLDKDVFWPDGGFWLAPEMKTDIRYSFTARNATVGAKTLSATDCRAVAAPSERIAKQFTARVRLELLKAAIEAFVVTYGDPPKRVSDLWRKPEWADVWPDGGFVGVGASVDPWGHAIEFVPRASTLRLRVSAFAERSVLPVSLTAEERRAMEAAARPRITEEERKDVAVLVVRLSDEDLGTRDDAAQKLVEMGPGVASVLEACRLESKDADVAARIKAVQVKYPVTQPAWLTELQPLALTAVTIPVGAAQRDANERAAAAALRKLTALQAEIRANDRDRDGVKNFWVKDVAGLHPLGADAAIAQADVSEARGKHPGLPELSEPEPSGGYVFAVLKKYETPQREELSYDDGTGRNSERFGIIAWPEDPHLTGHLAFIVNEGSVVFKYNMAPNQTMPTVFPADPPAKGWSRIE